MAVPRPTLPRAVSAYQAGKLVEAEALCRQIVSAQGDFFDALHLLAIVQASLGKSDVALASFDRALGVRPDHADLLYNRGAVLLALGRFDEALASYDRALALRPDYAEALNNRGNALKELKRHDEAVASYDRALALRPDYAEALYNRGLALHELNRLDEAVASYDRALALRPDYAEALNNRGNALHELNRHDEAVASYDRALALRPDYADALNNRGNALQELKRLDEALDSYDRAQALGGAAECAMKLCDWGRREWFAAELATRISGHEAVVSPFVLLGYSGDPALQLRCARNTVESNIPSLPRPLYAGETWCHDKLRIAYLSARFSATATAHLIAELLERHDHSRFEVIGVSLGADDGSAIRKRLVAAFDAFHDVRERSNREVAGLLYDRQIDIAVDLMGYMQNSRPGILACRPAPIQASYLGYTGTTGMPFIDYIIADKVVVPFEHRPFYTESIVHLPDCYQANDRKRKIAVRAPTRREAGLPEHAFVFCSFNNNWKITPTIFDVWMRLLRQVEGGVLWLLQDNDGAERNLRREAQRRGIDPSRLVFTGRVPSDEHLARHRVADLFLDTLPYNAHTTASDALWLGLPVLTCPGEAFAGRVAASLLQAIGLPELIAADLAEYEALALGLARDPARLGQIKAKLARHRETYPLFDTARLARHIEAAYTTMAEIWQRGEAPRGFSVESI